MLRGSPPNALFRCIAIPVSKTNARGCPTCGAGGETGARLISMVVLLALFPPLVLLASREGCIPQLRGTRR